MCVGSVSPGGTFFYAILCSLFIFCGIHIVERLFILFTLVSTGVSPTLLYAVCFTLPLTFLILCAGHCVYVCVSFCITYYPLLFALFISPSMSFLVRTTFQFSKRVSAGVALFAKAQQTVLSVLIPRGMGRFCMTSNLCIQRHLNGVHFSIACWVLVCGDFRWHGAIFPTPMVFLSLQPNTFSAFCSATHTFYASGCCCWCCYARSACIVRTIFPPAFPHHHHAFSLCHGTGY